MQAQYRIFALVKCPLTHRIFSSLLALLIFAAWVGRTVQRRTCHVSGRSSADLGSTITDAGGVFSLLLPARGASHRLIIQSLGYQPDTVAVGAAEQSFVRMALRRTAELGEVRVEERAPSYYGLTPTNTQVITSRDLTKSAYCNLAESFKTNAAVEVSTTDAVSGAKQIQLLGLDGAYSLLTVDNLNPLSARQQEVEQGSFAPLRPPRPPRRPQQGRLSGFAPRYPVQRIQ